MSGIRSFLLRSLGFAAFCAAFYPLYIAVLGFAMPDGFAPNIRYPLNAEGCLRTRIAEAVDHKPVDIVFLGSSHAYRGFDPRIWTRHGYSSFNLGSSAQTPIQTELMVLEYVPRLKPKLVIFEVHPGAFRDEGIESALDMIANRRIDRHAFRMAMRLRHPFVWNALAYGLIRRIVGLDARIPEPIIRGKDRYIHGGFVERTAEYFRPEVPPIRRISSPKALQVEVFHRILRVLSDEDVKVLLIEAPVTRWMSEGIFPERQRFDSVMTASGDYINMNEKVELSDSLHFATMSHLNQAGVGLFNEALIDTLERRGWLPEPSMP